VALTCITTTDVFDKRANNCAFFKKPGKKMLYGFHKHFIWQTFVAGHTSAVPQVSTWDNNFNYTTSPSIQILSN
jgi:hypothetical protein